MEPAQIPQELWNRLVRAEQAMDCKNIPDLMWQRLAAAEAEAGISSKACLPLSQEEGANHEKMSQVSGEAKSDVSSIQKDDRMPTGNEEGAINEQMSQISAGAKSDTIQKDDQKPVDSDKDRNEDLSMQNSCPKDKIQPAEWLKKNTSPDMWDVVLDILEDWRDVELSKEWNEQVVNDMMDNPHDGFDEFHGGNHKRKVSEFGNANPLQPGITKILERQLSIPLAMKEESQGMCLSSSGKM